MFIFSALFLILDAIRISYMNILKKITYIVAFLMISSAMIFAEPDNELPITDPAIVKDSIEIITQTARTLYMQGAIDESMNLMKGAYLFANLACHDASIEKTATILSIIFIDKWEYDSALHYLGKVEEIYMLNNESQSKLASLYSDFGRLYKHKGDYIQARVYYDKALTYVDPPVKESQRRDAAVLYYRIGAIENAEGHYEKAIDCYTTGLELARTIENNSFLIVSAYLNLSLPYAKLKQYEKSIEIQLKAIQLYLSDSVNYIQQLGKLYNNISLDYLELGQFEDAERYLNMSLNIAMQNINRTDYIADIFDSYGILYERRNELELALNAYQNGIIHITNDFNETDPFKSPESGQIVNKFFGLQLLKSKTNTLYKIFLLKNELIYLEAAINTAGISIQLIDELRNSYMSRDSKLQLAVHQEGTYKSALDMCYQAFQLTGEKKYTIAAFNIAEKTKSSVLLATLREMEAQEFGDIPEELLNRERVLSKRIAYYKENIYEENQNEAPDSGKLTTWEAYLFQEQREHNELTKQLEKQYPDYFALKYNAGMIEPRELQPILKKATVLEYALSDSALYIFMIEKDKFLVKQQLIDSNFYKLVQDYLTLFQEFDFSKQSYGSFTEYCWLSKELYNYLIQPFEDQISGNKLIIVPEGILSYLPFETLIRQVPSEIPKDYYRSLDYLLYDYAISYSYSSTLFKQVYSANEARGRKKLAAFAPEYGLTALSSLTAENNGVTRQKYRENLNPIPGVVEEIETISNVVSSDLFIGSEASETVFRRVAGKYDLLHLAMHTVVDNNEPMFSKLIFTNTSDTVNDGLLNTFEIFGLSLRARMVVLSACSTGEGGYTNGEGVMSLARGFVYAGSPSLVMTMWEVEDKSSITLMESFYQNLFKGKNKSEALKEAKIKFIQEAKPENTHPFFWSSYVMLGNIQAIAWKTQSLVYLVFISITVLFVSIFTVYKLYKRNIEYRT